MPAHRAATRADLDLVRNGRGYRQQIADEQEGDDEIDHQRPHGDLPMGKASASSLPIVSLRPNPNEFKITKSTPNPLIRTL